MQTYGFIAAVVLVLIAWSWNYDIWSNSPNVRRRRNPLSLGFSASALSALFLISGIAGFNLDNRDWIDAVIWSQVLIGVVLMLTALYLLRRGARDIDRRISGT